MPSASDLKWITRGPNDVQQFRQAEWNGISMRITAIGLDSCEVFVTDGGEHKKESGLSPCDAVKWAVEQAEVIHKDYLERLQKDKLETIQAVDKCISA